MPDEMPSLAAQVYTLILFVGGLGCLIHFVFFFQGPKKVEAEQSLSAWRLGFADFFIGVAAIILAVLLVQIVLVSLLPLEPGAAGGAVEMVVFGFATHLTALGTLLVFYRQKPEKFTDPFDRRQRGWAGSFRVALYSFLAVVPVIYPVTIAWKYLLEAVGVEPASQETVMIFAQVEQLPIMLLLIVLTIALAPLSEEVLFRGCLYRFLKAKTSVVPALLISGVGFSLLHQNMLGFVPLLLLGVVLAYSYELSGNIKVPILLHGIFNLNTVIIILVTDNAAY